MTAEKIQAWKPHPGPQELALRTVVAELLFGGSRGPGKTDAGIVWMMKPMAFPRYRGLVIRKNADDLRDWLDRARFMYAASGGEVIGNPAEIRWPSGAKIRTGHLKDDNAYEKYQGHEYQRVLIEELTQIPTEERYLKLLSSCRSTVDGLDARAFNTSNPGGRGHGWVKKRFVTVAPPNTKYVDPVTGRTRMFIPGKVTDNPTLMTKDPGYLHFLDGLPEPLRSAWRDGNWDVFEGAYFTEFDRQYHVYNPAEVKILPSWPRFRSIDWGFTSPMAGYWHAVGPDQHIYTYREYYETEKHDAIAAQEVASLTSESEDIRYTIGDPQSFPVKIEHWQQGKMVSVKRSDVWAENGVPMIMGNSARVDGWSRMRDYLRVRDYMGGKSAWWHISSQCVNLIEELSTAYHSKRNVEDIAADCVDHGLEATRLGLMSRPPLWKDKPETMTMLEAAEKQAEREEESKPHRLGAF